MEPVSAAVNGIRVACALYSNRKFVVNLLVILTAAVLAAFLIIAALIAAMAGALADDCATGGDPGTSSGGNPPYASQEPSDKAIADIPANYLTLYQKAAKDEGMDWAILAAIGKIETDHGEGGKDRTCIGSSAGAQGPMQFMPETWASMGTDGNGDGQKDVCDPEDAIPAAAGYLTASGAPEDYHAAIYAYNHAEWYVDDVLEQADVYRSAAGDKSAALTAAKDTAGRGLASVTAPFAMKSAHAELIGWNTVDSSKNIDYEEYTAYDSSLSHAVGAWNNLGTVDISPSGGSGTDMVIGDYSGASSVGGTTYSDGRMEINTSVMDRSTKNAQDAIFSHEWGHALGLGHTTQSSVMNTPITMNSSDNHDVPTDFDKEEYYRLWGRSGGGESADDSGGEGGIEGSTKAVFPLPEMYFDSYDDTWGASRGSGRTHEGTDMMAPKDVPIYSITDGTVVSVAGANSNGWNELGGYTTMIEAAYDIGPIQKGDNIYYAHQYKPTSVSVGESVKAGQQIGIVGDTGYGGEATHGQMPFHLHLGWYDASGSRAEAASGAMNPYPMLEWLKDNGGTVSGDGTGDGTAPAPCPEGTGEGSGGPGGQLENTDPSSPGSGNAKDLLKDPNFSGDSTSIADLESGIVDDRLIAALQAITKKHKIYLSCIKSGHPYGAYLEEIGLPDTPNSHYSGRTADIAQIDGQPVLGNGSSAGVIDVGRILGGLAPQERPDEIIGPTDWHAELGYPREAGINPASAAAPSVSTSTGEEPLERFAVDEINALPRGQWLIYSTADGQVLYPTIFQSYLPPSSESVARSAKLRRILGTREARR